MLELKLSGWECHRDLTLTTTRPVTIVCGANGIGKTAIVDALEFLFLGTGKLRGIGTKEALGRLSIHDDATECEVTLELEGFRASRGMTRDGSQVLEVNGKTEARLTAGQGKLLDLLGLDLLRARAALDAESMLRGKEDDRRAVIFGSAGAKATKAEVLEAFLRLELSGPDVAAYAGTVVTDGFRNAQRDAEAGRAAKTRELEALSRPEPQKDYRPSWTERSIDLSRLDLADLRKREKGYQDQVEEAERAAGHDLGAAEEADRQAKARLEEANAKLEALPIPGNLVKLQAELKAAEAAQSQANAPLAENVQASEHLREVVGTVDSIEKPEVCPAIPGGFACPATKARLEKHRAGLVSQRDAARTALEELDGCRKGLEQAVHETSRRWFAAQTALEGDEKGRQERTKAAARVTRLEDDYTTAAANLVVAQLETPATSSDFIRGRLENCRRTIEVKVAFDDQVADLENFDSRFEELEAERARIDSIAQALKPKGIELLLLEKRIGPLQAAADELGETVPACRFTIDGSAEIEVDGAWRHFVQASESYRLRLATTVQHAVARVAGFPLLVIDRFDHLDPPGKIGLLRAAQGVAGHYPGGVLLLATLMRATPAPAKSDDVETLWLHDGKVERVA